MEQQQQHQNDGEYLFTHHHIIDRSVSPRLSVSVSSFLPFLANRSHFKHLRFSSSSKIGEGFGEDRWVMLVLLRPMRMTISFVLEREREKSRMRVYLLLLHLRSLCPSQCRPGAIITRRKNSRWDDNLRLRT